MHPTGAADAARTSLEERYRVLLDVGRTLTSTLALEELYRVIYRETARILETDGFYISLYDPARDLATVVFYADRGDERRAEKTYKGSDSPVIGEGRATLVEDRLKSRSLMTLGDDQREVTRSAVSAPLRMGGRILGAVSCQSYRPAAYTSAELELLQGVADLAAVAVENAHYVAELQRRTREAEQIERIGRALVSSLDVQDVLGKVVEAALDLLGADGAAVVLLDEDLEARVAASLGDLVPEAGSTWNARGTGLAHLADGGGPIVVDDAASAAFFPSSPAESPAPGVGVAVPLLSAEHPAGALFAAHRGAVAKPDEIAVLERLASQASVALENARLHASVQSLSLTDPLTGLANRRHLRMHLEREVAAARRGRTLAAVMFDLDNFKRYNDALGHVAGDEALKTFAHVLSAENRAMNLVARFGGDEFVSILSDTSREGVELYVRRVTETLARDSSLGPHGIGVSSGLAVFDPATMDNGAALIDAADADLYRGKGLRNGLPPALT